MKMPRKLKNKWVKALRSGEYKQGKDVMYNPETYSFCCLGVLQHVADKGCVEVEDWGDKCYLPLPTIEWLDKHDIQVDVDCEYGSADDDRTINHLTQMNDGSTNYLAGGGVRKVRSKTFATIANWIEKNVEAIDV